MNGSRAPMQAATMKNAADEKSPGTATRGRREPGAAGAPSTVPPRAARSHAEALQHALGVIARDGGLDHRGLALGVAAPRAAPRTSPARWPPASRSRMPCSAAPPRMRTGGRPSGVSICAPICRSGFATRSIGRRISDASPTSSESNGCAASRPMNSRIAVPALPMSSAPRGAARPRRPTPSHDHLARRPAAATLHAERCHAPSASRGSPRPRGSR